MKSKSTDILLEDYLNHLTKTPEKSAVISQDKILSYQQFDTHVNRLAKSLAEQMLNLFNPLEKPAFVGVSCADKLQNLFAIFAILKLGAVFVPINPEDPRTRQDFIINKAELKLIITDNVYLRDSPEVHYLNIQSLDNDAPDLDWPLTPCNEDLAYVLFTSGSTAPHPKGVLQSRYGLAKQIAHYKKDLNITVNDCLLNLAIFSHDQAIVDCFGALLNGATLCLYAMTGIRLDTYAVQECMKKNQVTIFSSLPSLFTAIFEYVDDPMRFPDIRIVTIGGEESKVHHARLFQKTCPPHSLLINGYGATECSWLSSFIISQQTDLSDFTKIPLGFVAEGVLVKLLPIDEEEALQELCISADCLALGYLKDNNATKSAFFTENGATFYKTGDLVKINEEGCIEFCGRIKSHVQIKGKRINLNEVEEVVRASKFGAESLVLAHGDSDENKRLYLFHCRKMEAYKEGYNLRALEERLPAYMIPTRSIYLKELPKLPNAKVDQQALIAIIEEQQRYYQQSLPEIKRLKESEALSQVVEGFWREVLEIPMDATCTGFWEQGGDSRTAIQLTNKINHYFHEKYKYEPFIMPFRLFIQPTCTFLSFVWHVEDSFKNRKRLALSETITVVKANETKPYINDVFSEHLPMAVDYNYFALQFLVAYFKEDFNQDIHLFPTHALIIEKIKAIMDSPDAPSQSAFLLQRTDFMEAHIVPAVLCHEPTTNKFILLTAEGGGLRNLEDAVNSFGILSKIRNEIPELEIQVDVSIRAGDTVTCNTDALSYLYEALQSNMLQEITKKGSSICGYQTFISPAATFKTTLREIPDTVDQEIILKSDPLQRSLKEFVADHSKNFPIKQAYSQEKHLRLNTYLWELTHDFKKIIVSKSAELLQTSFHFSLHYIHFSGIKMVESLYMKKTYFTFDYHLEDFLKTMSLFIGVELDCFSIQGTVVENMEELINAAEANQPLSISAFTKKDLEAFNQSEEELGQKFISRYNISSSLSYFGSKTLSFTKYKPFRLKDLFIDALSGNYFQFTDVITDLGWFDKTGTSLTPNRILNDALKEATRALALAKCDDVEQKKQMLPLFLL